MDQWDGIIIGAAVAAVATVVVTSLISKTSWGGGEPNQTGVPSYNAKNGVLVVEEPCYTDLVSAPLAQNTPITEASYNQQPMPDGYSPAFGIYANQPNANESDALLPQ
jgi:hypothetical protein